MKSALNFYRIIALVNVFIFIVASCESPSDPSCSHNWDWVITRLPSTTEAGVETYTCLICGATGISRPISVVPTLITSVSISIDAPANGETPNTTATTTETGYTLSAVSWSPDNNPFLGGTVYTASLTMTARLSRCHTASRQLR